MEPQRGRRPPGGSPRGTSGRGGAESPRSGWTGENVDWRGFGWCMCGRGILDVFAACTFPTYHQAPARPESACLVSCLWPPLCPLPDGPTGLVCERVIAVAPGFSRWCWQLLLLLALCRDPPVWGLPFSLGGLPSSLCTPPPVPGQAWEETSVAPLGSRNGVMTSRCAGKHPAPPPGAAGPSGSVGAGPAPLPQ